MPCAFLLFAGYDTAFVTAVRRGADTGISLKVMEGCLMLIPDGPEEKRLRAMEQQLKSQQEELNQVHQRIKAVLA